MVARKIFHVLVGFSFGGAISTLAYLGGGAIYSSIHDTAVDPGAPFATMLPRYAMITSVALPLAVGVGAWRARRYVAIGLLFCGVASLICWLVLGRPTVLPW
jgi:hypothetical protein